MFVGRLLDQGASPLLEKMIQFTAARHELLAEDIVNATTPGYRQKDMSLQKFQQLLRQRRQDVGQEIDHPQKGVLFHDGNNRSMEYLMSELSKNALMHNMAVEMLRKQYGQMEMALKERVG